jgi:hypothetical protein
MFFQARYFEQMNVVGLIKKGEKMLNLDFQRQELSMDPKADTLDDSSLVVIIF